MNLEVEKVSLTFKRVDEIFKEYGLISHMLSDGGRTEYAFTDRESVTRKKNVATNVRPLMNGGVRGYIYVGYLEEYKFKHEAPLGYKYLKSAREHVKFNEMSEQELRALLEKVIKYYK